MSTVEQIKAAIEQLSLSQRAELEKWLHGWEADAWDRQIALDATTGRLDQLLAEVDKQIDQGKLREIP
jgi:hypothetical protein